MADEKILVNGVAVAPGAWETGREVALPSGRTAQIRAKKPTGEDLLRARRSLDAAALRDPLAGMYALLAQVARVDGKPTTYEEVVRMDLEDLTALMVAVQGDDFFSSSRTPSSFSPSTASGSGS